MRTYVNSAQRKTPNRGEVNTGKSMTMPNQAPSMRELLQRHALGIKDNVSFQGQFSGDMPDLRGYEPHELKTMLHKQNEKVKELAEIANAAAIADRQEKYEAKKERDLELLRQLQKENQE